MGGQAGAGSNQAGFASRGSQEQGQVSERWEQRRRGAGRCPQASLKECGGARNEGAAARPQPWSPSPWSVGKESPG